ncbi:hypothetical protein ACFW2V_13640 [Streptomyces sp. NPDC058947]|uniref:hypothetical protein n=1 Tax=Streptomyces sp. NPDC058947 TaxID=3346675 RepID=UPI003686D455
MSIGIDEPSNLSGFTIRELLIEVARTADGEELPAIREAAWGMQQTFKEAGTPSLSADQVSTYVDLISLAHEHLTVSITEEPDEFAPEDERRAYAVTQHVAELMHAVRHLGGQ